MSVGYDCDWLTFGHEQTLRKMQRTRSTISTVTSTPTLAAALRENAAKYPDSVAFAGPTGEVLATYGDLIVNADEQMEEFRRHGVSLGDRVLMEMNPEVPLVGTLLALWSLGATVVPIRLGEPELAQEVLANALEARFLFRQQTLMVRSGGRVHRDQGDVLLVMTSGSTGAPKAVRHSHGSVQAGCAMVATAWGWTASDELILALPLTHVHGLIIGLLGSLLIGARIRLFASFDARAVATAAQTGATMFFGVPTMYHRIVEDALESAISSLRLCVSGSAPLDQTLAHRLQAASVSLLERYGMTETLLTLSQPLVGERRIGWVGEPFPGVEIAVDDGGQLLVKTPALSPGFILPTPRELPVDDRGFFATGDLVERYGDAIRIAGRASDLIITGGVNVFPAEVEQALAPFPGIVEIAVAGRPSVRWGEEVVAFIIASDLDLEGLENFAREYLRPAARPKRYVLVEYLPRTELGKVRRRDLQG
jgi:acyl-CoA synthetase (AMP-forming)/AMP-acid ligase II